MKEKKHQNSFGERLKIIRTSLRMSQDKFASAVGISRVAIASYELSNTLPDIETFRKIVISINNSNYFKANPLWLLELSELPNIRFEEVLRLNKGLPNLWIRISNYSIPNSEKMIAYFLNENQKLELYDPLDERDKQTFEDKRRIYLDFVNYYRQKNGSIDDSDFSQIFNKLKLDYMPANYIENYYNAYEFVKRYGFLGSLYNSIKSKKYERNKDIVPDITLYGYLTSNDSADREKRIIADRYIKPGRGNDFEMIENTLAEYMKKTPIDRDLSLSIYNRYGINLTGYYELIDEVIYEMRELSFIIDKLADIDTLEKIGLTGILGSIDHYVSRDIDIAHVDMYNNVYETFTYKSLLGLMYYELLFDLKNDIYPAYCAGCDMFFIPRRKNDLSCMECSENSQPQRL